VIVLDTNVLSELMRSAANAMFEEDFTGRILPFSSHAAHAYALIAATRRQSGRPSSQFDAQIAAIAKPTGAGVATRDVIDFEGCSIKVIDPWRS